MNFVLASKSPRRKEILTDLGFDFEIVTAKTDESSEICEPDRLVTELSQQKAMAVKDLVAKDKIIVACDTVVAVENEILGKPKDEKDAKRMLKMLSDRSHSVYSGLCLIKGETPHTYFKFWIFHILLYFLFIILITIDFNSIYSSNLRSSLILKPTIIPTII